MDLEEPGQGRSGLIVGNINPGHVRTEFLESCVSLARADPQLPHGFIFLRGGPLVHTNRNKVVRHFLKETTAEWLLFVDSDIQFSVDAVQTLLKQYKETGHLIIAGDYHMQLTPEQGWHAIFTIDQIGDYRPVYTDQIEVPQAVECDSTGMGFCMIHHTILEEMLERIGEPAPWFQTGQVDPGVELGEDHWFFRQCKHRPLVMTTLGLRHIKTQSMGFD